MASLEELLEAFDNIIEHLPKEKRELVENAGEKMHRQVLHNIDTTTTKHTGRLRDACEKHVGSKGGYVAVRNNKDKAPHAHLVEEGHNNVIGGKLNLSKKEIAEGKKAGRISERSPWTEGKHMYRNAMNKLEDELNNDAEKVIDGILKGAGF